MQVEAAEMETRLTRLRLRRRRQARLRMLRRLALVGVICLVIAAFALSFAYAGSSARLAGGVQIAGIDVGGLTPAQARRKLQRRAAAIASVPLPVHIGGHTYRVRADELGLRIDWRAAAEEARAKADGFRPIRGFERLGLSIFGADVTPTARANRTALAAALAALAQRADSPHRDAAIRLSGLDPVVVPGREGRRLDRHEAASAIVGSFATLRRQPVTLPLRSDPVRVTAEMLAPLARRVRTALSAPVWLRLSGGTIRLPPSRLARLLRLPGEGRRSLEIGGPAADALFLRLERRVNRTARDADFVVVGSKVLVKPSADGSVLDVPRTAARILAAALSPRKRVTDVVVASKSAARTTQDAQAMGITGLASSYTTTYGGIPERIHNVQLVAHLIDDTLIAPGHVFSFNGTTGERNAAKGFLEAPVIINGELQTALGGGVCQVSTTVFNAAYEAGLKITARANHALYISHYPQGRDATVNYPDVDLKFVNDTPHWLLLRTFVGSSSLTVNLYGAPLHRRVESQVAPLRVTGPPPLEKVKDPKLPLGKRVVEEAGSPSLSTSVRRLVYDRKGNLLYDNVWYSSYKGEKRIVHIGTRKPAKKKLSAPA